MRAFLVVGVAAILTACSSQTQRELLRISETSDPTALVLERGYNEYVRRVILADGTETGIISCRDGGSARFWFRSHHLTDDFGVTLFRFSDGMQMFMSGGFCCEVQLPEDQLTSLAELRAFIRQQSGISP